MRLTGAYAVVATLLAAVFAAAILGGPYRAVQRSDYMTYQTAAHIVLDRNGDCLYTVECQAAAQRALIGEEPSFQRGALPFNSPPWLAAVVAPLGALPLTVAFAIFTGLSVLLLGTAAWRLAWGGPGTRLLASVLLLTAWPTVMGIIRGQSTLAVAALLGLSAVAAQRPPPGNGRAGLAGALAGLAALKPTLPPLWAAWLIARGRWRDVLAGAVVLALLVALAAVIVGPRSVIDYPSYLLGVADPNALGVHPEQMVNWRGAAARLDAGPWLVAAGTLATLALVGLTWWRSRTPALAAAAAFIATPLVIPHANQHEVILASLGILAVIAAAEPLRRELVAAAIGLHAVLWIGPALDPQAAAWLLFAALIGWLLLVAWLALREARYFRPVPVPAGTG